MRSLSRNLATGLLVLGGVCGGSAVAWAEGDERPPYGIGMMRKLGRGLANLATGPLEIIRVSSQVTEREGYFAGWTSGVLQGLAQGFVRELAGVYEVATFWAENPPGFAPVVRPEFVFLQSGWAPDEGTY